MALAPRAQVDGCRGGGRGRSRGKGLVRGPGLAAGFSDEGQGGFLDGALDNAVRVVVPEEGAGEEEVRVVVVRGRELVAAQGLGEELWRGQRGRPPFLRSLVEVLRFLQRQGKSLGEERLEDGGEK